MDDRLGIMTAWRMLSDVIPKKDVISARIVQTQTVQTLRIHQGFSTLLYNSAFRCLRSLGDRMYRSLRALRPGFSAGPASRPLAPSLSLLRAGAAPQLASALSSSAAVRPSIVALVRADGAGRRLSIRLYTTNDPKGPSETKNSSASQGTSGTATRPSANPNADQQNATPGPLQEVRPERPVHMELEGG